MVQLASNMDRVLPMPALRGMQRYKHLTVYEQPCRSGERMFAENLVALKKSNHRQMVLATVIPQMDQCNVLK